MPHQTVKTESVGACKMHSKCSLVVSCIVTAPVFSVGFVRLSDGERPWHVAWPTVSIQ